MEHSDIEHMAQGYPPACISKDCEEVIVWLATQLLATQEQRDALASENGSIKQSVAMHAAGFKICPACSHQDECVTDDIVWMVKETPATYAYLNSVRADAVASFAHHQRVIADAEPDAAFQRHRRFAAGLAEDFAAQLLAGKDGE